ncbi:MAG TPA: fumarylacetoacetate hydrolase family protein [Verrucomicrobiae bacterium]
MFKLCRYLNTKSQIRIGLVHDDNTVSDLTSAGVELMTPLLESEDLIARLTGLSKTDMPKRPLSEVKLLSPVERQEVWAAGVTYLRSKKARMDESEFSACAYDRVYDAERPEIFFKSMPEKTVPTGDDVGIRRDAKWNVPEPELALVINSRGGIVGYTIGNDMSSRDIEGENLLYLPQAKMYDRSCAVGPFVVVGVTEEIVRTWKIGVEIQRLGKTVFSGETSIDQIKRTFKELAGFLCRSQTFPHGALLLTGTGIVPNDDFTLQQKDVVRITVSGIGTLVNPVAIV